MTRLPPAHASAVLSDCANGGDLFSALIDLGYSETFADLLMRDALRLAYRFPGHEQPMPREERVAQALSHGGIA